MAAQGYGFEKFIEQNPRYVDWVLEEVRARGPLTAEELPELEGVDRGYIARWIPGAWFASVPRAVLEAHFGRGALAVTDRRPNFARAYDLAERALPQVHYSRTLDRDEAQRELLRLAARSHGIGTADDLADYYRMPIRQARECLAELVEGGELRVVQVEGWREPAYLQRDACVPRQTKAAALLSPFDPIIWYRRRVARLFQFEYSIEIFVPPAKRKWGYYVLPFLIGDRLVARLDLKADRSGRRLLVLAAYLEREADSGAVAEALNAELRSVAAWLGLESISVARQGGFARTLAARIGD